MFNVFSKILIVFLVLLQFFAPLLHAHTGDKFLVQGIHMPGLEVFEINYDAEASTNGALRCKLTFCDIDEGMVVGVNTGFKSNKDMLLLKQLKSFSDVDNPAFLLQLAIFINTTFLTLVTLFFLQKNIQIKPFTILAHTTRAPPL